MGIIPRSVYLMLVLMALVTTFMTTPLLRMLIRRTELEPFFEVSTFMQQTGSERRSLGGPA